MVGLTTKTPHHHLDADVPGHGLPGWADAGGGDADGAADARAGLRSAGIA